mmetsp:Transcript_168796/g.542502  ORF Transcript_168796/g.542502 Transcript_168796/m.542502 type:complete len:608 (-) Transcript_168796:42-1865(-)
MVVDRVRPRAAYRAVYLASPLKFHTTLHAFTRSVPQFHIDAWKKDPHAWEKHKWRSSKERSRGRWNYVNGPLTGVQLEGWPEPGLLGVGDLVQVSARAQAEKLQDKVFWEQVAERAFKLRDVISAPDLAVILDALVSADHRHILLMKTLAREIIDDVDKLSLVEVAVVANSYSHFRFVSKPLLNALGSQAVQLLSGNAPPYVHSGGTLDSDPGSLAILMRAFAALDHCPPDLAQAANSAVHERVEAFKFPDVVSLLESFVKAKTGFRGEAAFWASVKAKVPGSRMASLCPALLAFAHLREDEPALREALVAEILRGLVNAPASELPQPFGSSLSLFSSYNGRGPAQFHLPAFATAETPDELVALLDAKRTTKVVAEAKFDDELDIQDAPLIFAPDEDLMQPDDESTTDAAKVVLRWYNSVARSPGLPASPAFRDFDASRNFNRNRRGFRVGEAMEGLCLLWQKSAPGASELDLLSAAAPVLRSSLPGLTSSQLVSCAELYAKRSSISGEPCDEIVQDIVHEAVRKLSNFKSSELRRLRDASLAAGVPDPYLERARRRRFPKGLRRELRHEEGAAAASAKEARSQTKDTKPTVASESGTSSGGGGGGS